MAAYTQQVEKAGDRILDGIRQVDELIVKGVSTATQRIEGVLPEDLPGARFLAKLPKPEQLVKVYFDFAERLVKTQRTYSQDVVKAMQPILGRIWREPKVRKAAA
jgi:hypothetical protein